MKNFILGFIAALVLVGLIYEFPSFLHGFEKEKTGLLYSEDVKKAKEAVLCDAVKHSCSYFDKVDDSGSIKIVISAGENPVKGLEVDVAPRPGSQQYYVKLTDNSGVATFENIPSGEYAIYFNGVNFPKEYGDSPTVPVEITKGQTIERAIDLTQRR